jgi:hypothetical protein
MRKIAIAVLCSLFLPLLSWSQTEVKFSPEVLAFVTEDAPVVVLAHVRVIDGTGAAPRGDQTLVIAEGKIAALGNAATTKIPQGAKVLDLSGYTVIPGLVGMHDHMYYPAPAVRHYIPSMPRASRACIWPAASPRSGRQEASNRIQTWS